MFVYVLKVTDPSLPLTESKRADGEKDIDSQADTSPADTVATPIVPRKVYKQFSC
jgi:hypothetical protein